MEFLSKTDVFNLALLALGQTAPVVLADSDNTLTARILRQWWEPTLTKMLDRTDWRCFRKTGALVLMSEDYSESWSFKYKAPLDAHTILRVDFDNYFPNYDSLPERKIPYEMAYDNGVPVILTNVPGAYAAYVARPAPGDSLPMNFGEALAYKLAENAAPALITNNWVKMKDVFLKDARQKISEAIAADLGQQPERLPPRSSFADARRD